MGYNSHCQYQNCTYKCCNYNGDCPEWYSNGNINYTDCHYYYGVDPAVIIWTSVATAIGAIIIIIVAYFCYRQYKQKQDALLKQNSQFEISNQTLQTKPDVVMLGKTSAAVVLPTPEAKQSAHVTPLVPYGQPLDKSQMSRTVGPIYGIGNNLQKQM